MIFVLFGFLLFAIILLFVIFSELVAFLRTRVPFVPTATGDIEFIVQKLGIKSSDVFYDLGSGNGKVVFLVNKLSGATCMGFELGWWTVLFAKMKQQAIGNRQIEFRNRDFFKEDWSGANYIYAYLYPPLMGRIEEKFLADCKPGSIAIVRDFPLPNLKPIDIYRLPKKHEIYIYQK